MIRPRTIAIDGSAASGKSTLGLTLAQKYNYLYLDTGVMYRAVTWVVLKRGVPVDDEAAVSELTEKIELDILPPTLADGRQTTVIADGEDVTWLIRRPEVDVNVSKISSYPRVRRVLIKRQHTIAQQGPVVMVGRDIGTVVLPDADLKIFTQASLEVRAKRRYQELLARGEKVDYEKLLAAMARRDKQDREKAISPMVPADDAIIIQTDELSIEAVLAKVEALMKAEKV